MQLATDGHYREYAEMPRLPIKLATPERLQDFHRLTRQRRSQRDYQGLSISREELDALLYTACGVTGSLSWSGREVKLRAYPASGALYAVEIYPIVMRVDGLAPAIYHYRPIENVLELIRPDITRDEIVGVLLPVEREMVAGASAMICLAGSFLRHERKYGQGGYRMMVAEAGHISENLVLTATALGLGARPFGGVFDSLINAELRLEPSEEQFLLSVLIGHTGATIEQRRRDEA
jgi:SagB-type dehydrogenase family enzyme